MFNAIMKEAKPIPELASLPRVRTMVVSYGAYCTINRMAKQRGISDGEMLDRLLDELRETWACEEVDD